jgi:hypothetical protein
MKITFRDLIDAAGLLAFTAVAFHFPEIIYYLAN